MHKKVISGVSLAFMALPAAALAINIPGMPQGGNINIVDVVNGVFNILWPIAVAYIVIMFIVAGFQFFSARGNPAKVDEARQSVIWGVAGAAIILLASSIIFVVGNSL